MKATYKGFIRDGWQHTELIYEYRGHTYFVTKHNNGYMGETFKSQHQKEQAKIDYIIEHENDPIPKWKYEGSAEEGFDIFWKEVNK